MRTIKALGVYPIKMSHDSESPTPKGVVVVIKQTLSKISTFQRHNGVPKSSKETLPIIVLKKCFCVTSQGLSGGGSRPDIQSETVEPPTPTCFI